MFEFELNKEVKDILTGFKGIIMARTEYTTGCIQYGLGSQKLNKDGDIPEWKWFDQSRLTLTGKSLNIKKASEGPAPCAPSM